MEPHAPKFPRERCATKLGDAMLDFSRCCTMLPQFVIHTPHHAATEAFAHFWNEVQNGAAAAAHALINQGRCHSSSVLWLVPRMRNCRCPILLQLTGAWLEASDHASSCRVALKLLLDKLIRPEFLPGHTFSQQVWSFGITQVAWYWTACKEACNPPAECMSWMLSAIHLGQSGVLQCNQFAG